MVVLTRVEFGSFVYNRASGDEKGRPGAVVPTLLIMPQLLQGT